MYRVPSRDLLETERRRWNSRAITEYVQQVSRLDLSNYDILKSNLCALKWWESDGSNRKSGYYS
jgi:hypothetical protein